jgi:acyl carrier protein
LSNTTRLRVLQLVYDAARTLANEDPQYAALTQEDDTILFGEGALLDSLGLVNLIVGLEERIEMSFGITITLADERAMARDDSPFRTMGSLASWATECLRETGIE